MPHYFEHQVCDMLETEGFLERPGAATSSGFTLIEPELRPVYFLAVEDRTVQSYGRTIRAQFEHLGQRFTIYGLGDVVTRPAARRRGFGSHVVGAATAHIGRQCDADVAALLTEPKLESFYARHGWRHMPNLVLSTREQHTLRNLEGFPMALFASAAGQAALAFFHAQPLVVPGDEW